MVHRSSEKGMTKALAVILSMPDPGMFQLRTWARQTCPLNSSVCSTSFWATGTFRHATCHITNRQTASTASALGTSTHLVNPKVQEGSKCTEFLIVAPGSSGPWYEDINHWAGMKKSREKEPKRSDSGWYTVRHPRSLEPAWGHLVLRATLSSPSLLPSSYRIFPLHLWQKDWLPAVTRRSNYHMGLPLRDKRNTQHSRQMRLNHTGKNRFPPSLASSARYLGIPAQFC